MYIKFINTYFMGGGQNILIPPIFLNGGVRYPPPPLFRRPYIYIYIYIYIYMCVCVCNTYYVCMFVSSIQLYYNNHVNKYSRNVH